MPRERPAPNWSAWLRSWDRQQESFNPSREYRFSAMMDVLEARLGTRFRALDLGCGPGSFSQRILARFPRARVDAVDYDPVVRTVGEGALGTRGGRLTWIDAKLGARGWTAVLPARRYDAAVSTTALHWLRGPDLARLYRDLGRLLRPRGVFLNGDFLPWGPRDRPLRRLGAAILEQRYPKARRAVEWTAWRRWWQGARREPALRAAFREHRRRAAGHPKREDPVTLDFHAAALRRAGFRTVGVVWQVFENRVLYAER
jgi:SAM-dependent methyltransferase